MSIDVSAVTSQLIDFITKGNAHVSLEDAVENVSFENVGIKPNNLPFNIWMVVEHMRITQADILDFSTNENYKELRWPDEYWPDELPKDEAAWKKSIDQIFEDREQFLRLLTKPGVDLFSPFPHGSGQNLLREALLIGDHNSYHTGQIVLIRRLLNDWHS